MRIVFTSYSSSPGYQSPADWLHRIRGYTGILERMKRSHEVIGIERIDYRGEYALNGVQYHFIRLNQITARFPMHMHRLIKRLRPDIVFVNGFIFPFQIIQLKFFIGSSTKLIVLHRAERPFKGVKRVIQRLADRCIDHYLFASVSSGEEWLRKGVIRDPGKIKSVLQASSVFYPIDKEIARRATSVSGEPVFLWVGRLDANKDPLTILKAFVRYAKVNPAAALYMIYQGDELLSEVKKFIGQAGHIEDSVRLIGRVQHEELQNWYNAADYIFSGSHYEGSGISVVEGMSCGCIPIVTRIDSFRGMLGEGKCGYFFQPGNEEDLSQVLFNLAEQNYAYEKNKVLQHFREELSFEAIAQKINNLIMTNPGAHAEV